MEVLIKGNGSLGRNKGEEDRFGEMEVFMKDIGRTIKHMVMEG